MDVVTLGESMVLFTANSTGPIRFIEDFKKKLGGAESNVAIALSRLGHNTGWISRLGNDEFGVYVRNLIRGEGVDTSHVSFDNEHPTSVFFKERRLNSDPSILYYRKNSAFSMINKASLNEGYIKKAKYIHLTGITPMLSNSTQDAFFSIIDIAKKNNQKVVFDPNIRLKITSKQSIKNIFPKIIKHSDIVLPGLEEGELLTKEKEPEKIAQKLLNLGPKLIVIKLGEEGAYYATNEHSDYVPGYKITNVVDTVGAGDGFAAGFLSGLIKEFNLYNSIRLGNYIGASALSVEGDIEGYPLKEQIEKKNNEILR